MKGAQACSEVQAGRRKDRRDAGGFRAGSGPVIRMAAGEGGYYARSKEQVA